MFAEPIKLLHLHYKMTYKIRIIGDPVLHKSTEDVTEFDKDLAGVVSGMVNTMTESNGVGLSAPQVGVSKKIFIFNSSIEVNKDLLMSFINPEIIETEGVCEFEEGCLSIPGIFEYVARPEKIWVKYFDIDGNEHEKHLDGLSARIFQHERDHLSGILFIDRLSSDKRNQLSQTLCSLKKEWRNH